jgi:predicted transcriptional regulator of viral defense system
MSYERLLRIDKPFFSQEDVAHALGIGLSSARVLCSRYVKKGLLTRLKRGLYARTETLAHMGQQDLFQIANFLQVPSYVSLMTALSYYGITTQVQRNFFESISIKRTKTFEAGGFTFRYTKISPRRYGGFEKKRGAFVALPEKAILDCFYLASLGRYALDISSLDLTRINEQRLLELTSLYPLRAIRYFERYYENIRESRSL